MRTLNIAFVSLIALFGGVQIAGCAAQEQQRATGQVFDDSMLTAKVKNAIVRDSGFSDAMDVNVNSFRGVVQLSGFVESEELMQRAEEIAEGVDGVRSVHNDLHLAPPRN